MKLKLFSKPIGINLKYWNSQLKSNTTGYSIQGICDMINAYRAAASDLGCLESEVIQISKDDKTIFDYINRNDKYESKASAGYYPIDGSEAYLLIYENYKIVQCDVCGHYTYFLSKKTAKRLMKSYRRSERI